ncbi:heparinase II/III domain-containing protein [Pseudoduganella armeniaca]|uniref:Heparinase II/III-like C-terminal domain-containing protein n=1 Tax=Pseudoduganella armeniaca TaxID=2072590 RepID=A0A2R4C8J2_9BURK|nr:heparinase II/III family protein [Pseudoduganella armeniaca]AVR95943.1 hypothetical protein C9I28_09525 [Pseudoduganella armeniaca]
MIEKTLPKAIAVLTASLLLASHASAQTAAVKIKGEHPRLYGTQADFDRLKQTIFPATLKFPAKKGTLKFKITPLPRELGDDINQEIFGSMVGTGTRLVIRHADITADPIQTRVKLQMGLRGPGSSGWIRAVGLEVQPGLPVELEFTYDVDGQATLRIGTETGHVALPGTGWSPADQVFDFLAHRKDRITDLKLIDNSTAETVWEGDLDLGALSAWRGLIEIATRQATTLSTCPVTATPATDPALCDTTNGGRNNMTDAAKRLGLAYRMTGRTDFLAAIKKHVQLMAAVPLTAGGEWSMSARVGALGIYYDWLYDQYKGTSEGDKLAKLITDTIAANKPDSSDDIIASVCGSQQLVTDGPFDCATKPVFTGWVRGSSLPSTATGYVGAHTASAVTGAVLGLIAIADHPDYAKVGAMIDTIYDHFALGFLPARDLHGVDGGNYSAFAYGSGSGETLDRLVMWQRAIAPDSPKPALKLGAAPKILYPYLYAMRPDGTFPARGDNFENFVSYPSIGSMALTAVTQESDKNALDFYERYIVKTRSRSSETGIWDRLLYPYALPQKERTLPLSEHFRMAGNVLMRDTWNYANSTLLEFKSTSFISENHHHLDQNSFSLHYKSPLLLDSGQYDNYGTGHWWNYYQRTIAHNAIVVYDPNEKFATDQSWGNDGGQWYDGRPAYPTIDEITPGGNGAPDGSNVLTGVTAFKDGEWYSYVSADAARAYKRGKLAPRGGAVRSIVYLRHPEDRNGVVAPPTILVFDRVQAGPAAGTTLAAPTSLLHMVDKPASNGTLGTDTGGRFAYSFGNTKPVFTVRNGAGMVTIQALLPASPSIVLSGGKDQGSTCKQITYKDPAGTTKLIRQVLPDSSDCRFLIREAGTGRWINHAPDNTTNVSGDVGNWRLEISPAAKVAATVPQYFLNVLHVADNDKGSTARTDNLATQLGSSANVVAVKTVDGTVVVFNDEFSSATSLSWQPNSTVVKTVVVGLVKGAYYRVETGTGSVTLTKIDASGSSASGVRQASDQGVIEL